MDRMVLDETALSRRLRHIYAELVAVNESIDSRELAHFTKRVNKYNGRTDIEMWLLEVKQFLSLFPRASERQKVSYMMAQMTGDVLQTLGRAQFGSVEDVCKRLRDVYGMPLKELHKLRRQGENESTYEFLIRMSIAVRNECEGVCDPREINEYLMRLLCAKARPEFIDHLFRMLNTYINPVP